MKGLRRNLDAMKTFAGIMLYLVINKHSNIYFTGT